MINYQHILCATKSIYSTKTVTKITSAFSIFCRSSILHGVNQDDVAVYCYSDPICTAESQKC